MFGVDCCRCGGVREDMRQDVGEQAGYVDAPTAIKIVDKDIDAK